MTRGGCSALRGVNPNFLKNSECSMRLECDMLMAYGSKGEAVNIYFTVYIVS